ncbi:hypothetical protein ACJJID_03375 [Microbulbifer sp. CnH-101-G]|uniref:hypothetical protein n=1 Tax=Microbulbifer sp. CnH-101-G TaxID=3243393 RepID=UPI00403A2088
MSTLPAGICIAVIGDGLDFTAGGDDSLGSQVFIIRFIIVIGAIFTVIFSTGIVVIIGIATRIAVAASRKLDITDFDINDFSI